MLAVENLHNPYNTNWTKAVRDYKVYSKRTLKRIKEWKKEVSNSDIQYYYERLNIKELSDDQKIMLKVLDSNTENEIIKIAKSLLPYYKNSDKYFWNIFNIKDRNDILTLKNEILNEDIISKRDKQILLESLEKDYIFINE